MYTFDQITNIHILFALWPSETINENTCDTRTYTYTYFMLFVTTNTQTSTL